MNTTEPHRKHDVFVSATTVVQHPRSKPRTAKRLARILQAEQVVHDPRPVPTGPAMEKIRIIPIMENGQIKALRAICACGSESTYDIQYDNAPGETP